MEDIHMHIEESFLYVVTWVHIKSVQALAHFVDQFKLRPTGKVWKAVFPFLYRCQALNLNTVLGPELYLLDEWFGRRPAGVYEGNWPAPPSSRRI